MGRNRFRSFLEKATFVAVIMAVGSCFAAMNTMYASVARRAREVGTLRVLGFSRGGIWGLLPPSGKEVLDGLIPLRDDQLYPLPQVNA